MKPGRKSLRANGTKSRSRPNSLSHRRRVAVRLLGIGGTEACDRVGVDGPLGRSDINVWPRLVVEMPVAVGARTSIAVSRVRLVQRTLVGM